MKRHVELWAFNSKGEHVATGLVTPAGVCGFRPHRLNYFRRAIHVLGYKTRGFGYGVTDKSESQFKERTKAYYRAVRFQRVLVGE